MISYKRLTMATSLLLALVNAGKPVVTIPIQKKAFDRPVTRTQKMVNEVHHKYLNERYETLLQMLGHGASSQYE